MAKMKKYLVEITRINGTRLTVEAESKLEAEEKAGEIYDSDGDAIFPYGYDTKIKIIK